MMTVVELLNLRCNFPSLIEKINQKLEKANKCVDVEREYASKTSTTMSLDLLKLTFSRKKHLKQLMKILKKSKRIIDDYIELIVKKCVDAEGFGDTVKVVSICISCYDELYKNFITVENFFDEITNAQADGSKESVDYLENINSIIKQHYCDVLLQKTTIDKILTDNEEKISLNLSQNFGDFQDEN